MEPDVCVLTCSPAGLQRAHARNHSVGPTEGSGGGEQFLGRGK